MRQQKIVGVIFSRADLERALRMRKPPDLFELRLDRLVSCLSKVREVIARLPAPLILTARDPREGGAHNLSPSRRRALLLEFLPQARYVDVELRSVSTLRSVLETAARKGLATIISYHDFKTTPSPTDLDRIVARARSSGATIVKIATRTDTATQLDTLLRFFKRHRRSSALAAMGIGRLGRISRLNLARCGSVLNYTHLSSAGVAGQLSVEELRRFASRPDAVS
jgi:3-dehydroquinate dehydratase-1